MPNKTKNNIHQFKVVPKVIEAKEDNSSLEADIVLTEAIGQLNHVVIIGQTDNNETYIASTTGNKKELLYWIEDFKMRLMAGAYDE